MRRSGVREVAAVSSVLVVGFIAVSCARPALPPGGPEDRLGPLVVTTYPDTFQLVEDLDRPIRIEFSERILGALGNQLDGAVLVSPRSGEVAVKHKGDAVEVEMESGLREDLVYRVTVLTRIADLFGNPLEEPFEFVFSTGGEFTDNVIAGLAIDRITGRASGEMQVVARPLGDTTVEHVSQTDQEGAFAMRYVPAGVYEVLAFEDRDRNGAPSPFEVQGRSIVDLPDADTVLTDVVVLLPDTTAAGLLTVAHLDSVTLRLTTDDYLDPEVGLEGVTVVLEPDSAAGEDPPPPPEVLRLFTDSLFNVYRDSVRQVRQAAADSARADSAGVDTAGVRPPARPPPPAGVPPGGAGPGRRPRSDVLLEGTTLPYQEFLALLDAPIPAELPYRVIVSGLVNVNGVSGGGGERTVEGLPPDTSAVQPGVPPDTGAVVPDTGSVTRLLRRLRSPRRE